MLLEYYMCTFKYRCTMCTCTNLLILVHEFQSLLDWLPSMKCEQYALATLVVCCLPFRAFPQTAYSRSNENLFQYINPINCITNSKRHEKVQIWNLWANSCKNCEKSCPRTKNKFKCSKLKLSCNKSACEYCCTLDSTPALYFLVHFPFSFRAWNLKRAICSIYTYLLSNL